MQSVPSRSDVSLTACKLLFIAAAQSRQDGSWYADSDVCLSEDIASVSVTAQREPTPRMGSGFLCAFSTNCSSVLSDRTDRTCAVSSVSRIAYCADFEKTKQLVEERCKKVKKVLVNVSFPSVEQGSDFPARLGLSQAIGELCQNRFENMQASQSAFNIHMGLKSYRKDSFLAHPRSSGHITLSPKE
jgi:hypothetical protein